MRRHFLVIIVFIAVLLTFAGCAWEIPPIADAPQAEPVAKPQTDPAVDALNAQVAAQARRLTDAPRSAGAPSLPPPTEQIIWLDPRATAKEQAASPAVAPQPTTATISPAVVPSQANPVAAVASIDADPISTPQASVPAPAPGTGTAPDFASALRTVPDSDTIAKLPPEQQESVRMYHQVADALYQQLVSGGGAFDRAAFEAQLDEILGERPITIHNMTLCKRVMGFGVYEPFESTTFLAGRDQKAIIYIELENFATAQREGQFGVDLQQEVTLYSSDGLAVWRNEPVKTADLSRNRRHDFFVVQLITLPQRLGVGKYRLKIRVTDLNGGSIDEQGVNLNFVADSTLARTATPPASESQPISKP